MLAALDRFVQRMAGIRYSPWIAVLIPVVVGCIRVGLEGLFGYGTDLVHLFNNVVFYFGLQTLMTAVVALAAGRDPRTVIGAVSVGLVVAWLPPIMEGLFSSIHYGRSFRFVESFAWHAAAPGQPVWETVSVWLGVGLAAAFTGIVSRSVLRAAAALVGAWGVFQVVGWACYAAAAFAVKQPGLAYATRLGLYNLIVIVACLAVYVGWNRATLLPSLGRINHALPFGLVTVIGARLGGRPWASAALKGLLMLLCTQLLIFANDWFDREQDAAHGGQARPVSRDDVVIVVLFQVLFVVWAGMLEPKAVVFVLLYFVLAAAYHHPGLRLKRMFCASYKMEGMAAAACLLFGAGGGRGGALLRMFALLTFGGFALHSMFKDYKDVEQDRSDRIGTIYTRYLARGRTLRGIHLFVALATSLSLLVPPAWLLGRGAPAWHAAPLAALAPVLFAALWWTRVPRAAVERGFWCLSLYLAAFVAVLPAR